MARTLYFCSGPGQGLCQEFAAGDPPTGWQDLVFDDSLWTVPVARTPAAGDFFHFAISIPGALFSGAVQVDLPSPSLPRTAAYRYKFVLPRIPIGLTITSATLLVNVIENGATGGQYAVGYINGNNVGMPTDTFTAFGPFNISVPASYFASGENIFAIANHWDAPFSGCMQFGLTITLSAPPPDWLVTVEPITGVTKQGKRLFMSSEAQHSFTLESRKRGSANYTLSVVASDTYEPTIGQQIWLYDQNKGGFTLVFTGFIQSFKNRQIGINGDRFIDCVATSLESVFDTIYAEPQQFVNMTCGQIATALYNAYEASSQVSLGTISDGVTIPLFNTNYEKISDLLTQLATTSGFVWGVDPSSQALFFCLPGTVAAPLVLTSSTAMWDSINWETDGSDYRNRQAVRLSYDAFTHSAEFFAGAGQQSFTLLRSVDQVTNAYVTLSTPNSAFGVFSGQPSAGDTVTVGPFTGTAWIASHIYALNGIIVVNGYVQKVTDAGTSGGTIPAFSILTGATTTDSTVIWTCQGPLGLATGQNTYTFALPDLRWGGAGWLASTAYSTGNQVFINGFVQTCTTSGTSGSTAPAFNSTIGGTTTDGTATWTNTGDGAWHASTNYIVTSQVFINGFVQSVTTAGASGTSEPSFNGTIGGTTTDGTATWTNLGPYLDNTQYGLVLIDPTGSATGTCTHLVDALNSNAATRGITFSLPTWENSQGNAILQAGQQFQFTQKAAGTGYIASLSFTGTHFSWVNGLSPVGAVTQTFGGSSPQGSVGPNEGATISLQVYADGTNTAAPACVYTHGSNVIKLASPLNPGTNLNVEYTRPDGNVIEVENTPLILALANVTFGTGEVQQISDQSSQGLVSTNAEAGLQLAQQALAAFDIVPLAITIELLQAGILPGQLATLALSGALAIINGTYFVQEVSGQLVPVWNEGVGMDSLQAPQAGHYRYTLKLIDVAQIGSYLDFWEGMGGGGSGAGGGGDAGGIGSGLSATSGGIQSGSASELVQGGTKLLTGAYTATAADYGLLLSFTLSSPATLSLPTLPFVPVFPQWSVHVENNSASNNLLIGTPIGINLDGVSGGLIVPPQQGVYLTTDGVNYYTERGLSPSAQPGAMIQIAAFTVSSLTQKVSFPSIPGSYNHLVFKVMAAASDGVWAASTAYTTATIMAFFYSATSTYYYWHVTTGGTSGGTIPAFSTHNSGTLTDGSVVWTNIGVDSATEVGCSIAINGDFTNSNYFSASVSQVANSTNNPVSNVPGGTLLLLIPTPRNARPAIPGAGTIDIPFYKNSTFGKIATCTSGVQIHAPGSGNQTIFMVSIGYLPLSVISQIDFLVADNTWFAAGSQFFLYGIN